MGIIGRIINHEIEKHVKIILETRKGFNQTGLLYNPSGEDSPPCKEDRMLLVKIDGTGKYIVVGTLTESQGAKPGQKIFFSRDESGKIQSKISMLGDGSVNADIKKDSTLNIEGDLTLEVKGTISRTGKGDIKEEAVGNYTIKARSIKLTGDTEIILSTIGSPAWVPNCIPTCPFGIPHGGQPGGITGLKGA